MGDLGSIPGFDPWVGKIPWRRKWQPTLVLLPGESYGRRSLVGYSPQGRKESDTTERLHLTSLHTVEYHITLKRIKWHIRYLKLKVKSLSRVRLFATPREPVAHQAPLFMGFSRQEWLAISFSRGSSRRRDRTQGSNPGLFHYRQTLNMLKKIRHETFHIWYILTLTKKKRSKEFCGFYANASGGYLWELKKT